MTQKDRDTIEESKYMYELVKPSKEYYDRLQEIIKEFPDLIFQNTGYEYLSKKVREERKDIIQEVTSILNESLIGFVTFFNFRLAKDGHIDIRLNHRWDNQLGFTGVGYFHIEHWNPENHGKY